MKKAAIIATGGTIAGQSENGASVHYRAGELPVEEILAGIPAIADLAELEVHSVCSVDSNDITSAHLQKVKQLCEELDARGDIDGIVVTHGTDTLEETSFLLNLACKISKPLVITGAMRPASAASADGPMNLYQATALALDPQARSLGVLAVFSSTIYSGRDIAKQNAMKVDAFDTNEFGILGYMRDDKAYLTQAPYRPHTFQSELTDVDLTKLPPVEIFDVHQNCDPRLLEWMLANYPGVVIAGTGAGNYPKSIQEVIENTKEETVIVRCSRLAEGLCFPSEVFDPQNRTIPSYRLSPVKARILLQLGLAKGMNKENIRRLFETY